MLRPLTLLFVSCLPAAASAHDLWIVPQHGALSFAQGMDFPKSEGPPKVESFQALQVRLPSGKLKTLGCLVEDKRCPKLDMKPSAPGLYIAAAITTPKTIELDAAAFNSYLVSDGMPHIYLQRAEASALDRPAKEHYQKWVKALLRTGEGPGDPTQPLGHVLEIVPLKDPTKLTDGQTLPVKVLFQGRPLDGARLGWDHPGDGPEPSGTARTNAQGRALIPIAQPGLMTLRLTHMTQPKRKAYEWSSYWTTLTFRVPGAPPTQAD